MRIYFHSGFLQVENNKKREGEREPSLPPAVTLHTSIIIDLHQQCNPVHIRHQTRQPDKHIEFIVKN